MAGGAPGGWAGDNKIRAAAGLLQLRAFKWCLNAIERQEGLRSMAYEGVFYSRFDLLWLGPLPDLRTIRMLEAGRDFLKFPWDKAGLRDAEEVEVCAEESFCRLRGLEACAPCADGKVCWAENEKYKYH